MPASRWIGVLYQIAGVGYIANTLALIVAPAWSGTIMLVAVAPVIVGEVSLAIWLLVKGIDPEGWNRRQLTARRLDEPAAPAGPA